MCRLKVHRKIFIKLLMDKAMVAVLNEPAQEVVVIGHQTIFIMKKNLLLNFLGGFLPSFCLFFNKINMLDYPKYQINFMPESYYGYCSTACFMGVLNFFCYCRIIKIKRNILFRIIPNTVLSYKIFIFMIFILLFNKGNWIFNIC